MRTKEELKCAWAFTGKGTLEDRYYVQRFIELEIQLDIRDLLERLVPDRNLKNLERKLNEGS